MEQDYLSDHDGTGPVDDVPAEEALTVGGLAEDAPASVAADAHGSANAPDQAGCGPVPPSGVLREYGPPPAAPIPPSEKPTRPRRWRWVASLVGVVAVDLLIQIVFSVFGMLLLELAAQAGVMSRVQADALIDDATVLIVLTQLVRIAAMWPWWRHMVRETMLPRPAAAPSIRRRLESVAGLVLMGLGLQFVLGVALTVILPLFPDVMDEYTELMDSSGAGPGNISLLSVLSVTVLAAVGEEIVCRGIMLEYALRATCGYGGPGSRVGASSRMFWIANALQAAAFGLLHLNIVQSSYAFLLGMVMGWVYWKTRDLRYPMVLHLAINGASYVIEPVSAMLPGTMFLILLAACLVAGVKLFAMTWGGAAGAGESVPCESSPRCSLRAPGQVPRQVPQQVPPRCPTPEDSSPEPPQGSPPRPPEG